LLKLTGEKSPYTTLHLGLHHNSTSLPHFREFTSLSTKREVLFDVQMVKIVKEKQERAKRREKQSNGR
jgi:hypothetical protein